MARWVHLFADCWPPSVNHIWRQGWGKTYLTPKARLFHAQVGLEMLAARGKGEMPKWPLEGPLTVRLSFFPPNRRRRDIDNLVKSVLDALTKAGLWKDDSQIERLEVALSPYQMADANGKRGSFWIAVEERK